MDLLAPHTTEDKCVRKPDPAALQAEIDALDLEGRTEATASGLIEPALRLVRAAPDALGPQLLAANLFERSRRREDMLDTWTGLHSRFPECHTAFRMRLRWLGRMGDHDTVVALLEAAFDAAVAAGDDLTRQAEIYGEIRDPAAADKMFQRLIAADPENIRVRVVYGKLLFSRGDIVSAFDILDPLRGMNLSPTAREVLDKNDRAILAMEALEENSSLANGGGATVLRNAISLFRSRQTVQQRPNEMGGIFLYTGSLGPGGAERQMTQLADVIHRRVLARRNVHGVRLAGPVEVMVNHTDKTANKDFFRSNIEHAGIPLTVAKEEAPQDLAAIRHLYPDLEDLFPLLPRSVRFGLERLYRHLADRTPEVFYIWQDGAVLTGALAALMAGVPRIAISLRGLPPSMRPNLMKPEYLDMYQALGTVPGVSFSCNSSIAADAYAEWTGLARDRFSVIYNAIRPHPVAGSAEDAALWQAFDTATEDATVTLGGVFRFTPNKRGLLWVEWAAKLLAHHPNMRFVLVGDGVERTAAEVRAKALGIADRVLFVGNSSTVGFWLEKMDVLSLLSENEGLPNTLIEAQVAGVPVISTPAGGAEETMLHGRTGYLLSSATEPDFEEYSMFIDLMLTGQPGAIRMGQLASAHIQAKFDVDHVLSQTIRFFQGEQIAAREEVGPQNVTPIAERSAEIPFSDRIQNAYSLFAQR